MIPIYALLSRIRWDSNFGEGVFELGYYDRVSDSVELVPFAAIDMKPGDHFAFQVINADGQRVNIPYHRVRQVFKNGECIWQR